MEIELNEICIISDALNVYIECTEEMLKDPKIDETERCMAMLGLAIAKHTLTKVDSERDSFFEQPTLQ